MSNSNGVISRPVNQRDVQTVLRISSSINKWSQLCTHVNINKWAKYKPVRYTSNGIMSQYDFTNEKWRDDSTWWKADGMCGMSTTVATEFGEPFGNTNTWSKKLVSGQLGWAYNKPNGGTFPYRIVDFIKYFDYAVQPYGEIGSTNIYVDNQWTAQIDWDVVDVDPKNLKLSDFAVQINGSTYRLTNMYLGLIIWTGTTYYLFTSSNTFGSGESLSIELTGLSQSIIGTWNCMPFFTLNQVNPSTRKFNANGVFVSMADTTPISVTFSRDGSVSFDDVVIGEWTEDHDQVYYDITINNTSSTAHTFSEIYICIKGDSYAGNELPNAHVRLYNVTVPANDSVNLTGYINAVMTGYDSYWIVVSDATQFSTIVSKYMPVDDPWMPE